MKPGSRVGGDLKLVKALGQGAAGTVWEAQRGDGRRVAVKFAGQHIVKDPTERARFAREATLAMSLESKHVVQSSGYGIGDNGLPYIVMELLSGETLEDLLERERVVGTEMLVRILAQTAEALDEAHERNIVHRDVKPSNLFLVKENEDDDPFVKVLDFGMAKLTDTENPGVVTAVHIAVGTPDYMSPEQIEDARDIDHRVDVWALGAIAYRALVGQLPFKSETFAGLCVAIAHGNYEKPTTLAPYLPRELDAWCARCLAVDREDRFSSAGEAVAALSDALSLEVAISYKEPAQSAPPPEVWTPSEMAPKRTERGPFELAFTLVVALTALLLGAVLAMYDGF